MSGIKQAIKLMKEGYHMMRPGFLYPIAITERSGRIFRIKEDRITEYYMTPEDILANDWEASK